MFFSFAELQISIYFYWGNVRSSGCDLTSQLMCAREHSGESSQSFVEGLCASGNPARPTLQAVMVVQAGLIVQLHMLSGRMLALGFHATCWHGILHYVSKNHGPRARKESP